MGLRARSASEPGLAMCWAGIGGSGYFRAPACMALAAFEAFPAALASALATWSWILRCLAAVLSAFFTVLAKARSSRLLFEGVADLGGVAAVGAGLAARGLAGVLDLLFGQQTVAAAFGEGGVGVASGTLLVGHVCLRQRRRARSARRLRQIKRGDGLRVAPRGALRRPAHPRSVHGR